MTLPMGRHSAHRDVGNVQDGRARAVDYLKPSTKKEWRDEGSTGHDRHRRGGHGPVPGVLPRARHGAAGGRRRPAARGDEAARRAAARVGHGGDDPVVRAGLAAAFRRTADRPRLPARQPGRRGRDVRAARLARLRRPQGALGRALGSALRAGPRPGRGRVGLVLPVVGLSRVDASHKRGGGKAPLRLCFGTGSSYAAAGWRALPSCSICGIQPSDLGSHQFRSPSSFMLAGRSTPRISVASIRTANASPTPICLNMMNERLPKIANTATITTAALVTTPAVFLIAYATASSVFIPLSYASRTLERMNTW